MPAAALALALAAAVTHALWNLLLARAGDPQAATAVALVVSVVAFAPVAAWSWRVQGTVWPFVAASAALQLVYFVLLACAYARAELSVVYPVARGVAPVLVLLADAAALGVATSLGQALGVVLVGAGVLLVRGLRRGGERAFAFGLAIAACIAAYTLVDAHGVLRANAIAYLELAMVPAAVAYAAGALRWRGVAALRGEIGPASALAGIASFGAYVLVLEALRLAPAASVAAVRETSVLIATALAAPLLRERVGRSRLAGAALVVAGTALLALG